MYKKRKISIRVIFPLIMSLAIAICIISCMVLFSYCLSNYFVSETVSETGRQKEALSREIENETEEINDLINTIYYHNIKQYDFSDNELASSLQNILRGSSDQVLAISIFDLEGNIVWSSDEKEKKAVTEETWFVDAKDNIEKTCFGERTLICSESVCKIIPVSRYIEYAEEGQTKSGVLCLQFSVDAIESVIDSYENNKDEYCYLMDENGHVLYHPFMLRIQSGLYQEKTIENLTDCDNYLVKKYADTSWVIQKQQIGYTGWSLVVVNSLCNIRTDNLNLYYAAWLSLLLVGIVLIIMDMALFRNITNPVYRLLETMQKFGTGDYSAQAKEDGIGELKILSAQFNIMAAKLQKQIDEIRNNEREKREMEKKLLQSQINPHFLYNTLDSIIWMIQSREYEGAEQMISLLAKFFRGSLSKGKDIVTLEKEEEHAASYLAIQNIRFKDKFEFVVNVDSNLMQYSCPKLLIQPLLENAIYHGMEGMYDDGKIEINIYEKEDNIHIDVVDNGLGMSEETIDYIMHNKVVSSKRGSGIGVRNVDERIKLFFGEEYGVFIESEIDEGTIATIIIPKRVEINDK